MTVASDIPELGSALGRLTGPGTGGLAEARLGLVTSLFEAAAAARAGDAAALAPAAWRARWEAGVAAAARVVSAEAEAGLARAAAEARMPARLRGSVAITDTERRSIAARLGSEGAQLLRALGELGPPGGAEWEPRVLGVTRTLEAAWLALEAAAGEEQARWAAEAERVRQWRRPRWPAVLMIAGIVLAAAWVGLALGGWLPPGPLAPLRDWLLALP
jgi:hypothetical protein